MRAASRIGRGPRSLAIFVVVTIAALVALFWFSRASPKTSGEHDLVVTRQPFTTAVSVVGLIQPGDGIPLFAPFDGAIRTVDFAYGDRVGAGQALLTLDAAEIEDQRDGAEADYLKAKQAMADIAGWDSGPDMARARRAKTSAAMDLRNLDRTIVQTRALLDRGLVPRSEYESLVEQRRSLTISIASVDDDYAATLGRGRGVNRRVAMLDLARARARLDAIEAQMRAATIRAPAGGIILAPPRSTSDTIGNPRPGSRLSKDELVGSIARTGSLSVEFKLDEVDVNRIAVGQPVSVTGPAFDTSPLPGRVTYVGGEAIKGSGQVASKATFAAVARLDPVAPAIAAKLRLGMSATVTIETYSSAAAIVVPPAAVSGTAPSASVMVRNGSNRSPRIVTIGHISPDGVEIVAGLTPGETIVWDEAPPDASPTG